MSRVPRIRFKGFEEDWEQRKLGDMAERIIRKNEKLESTLPLTISAQYGLIDQNEFFDKRIASKDVRGYYLIKKGEFAYNKSTSVDAPLGAIKRLDKYKNGVLSTLYILFKIIDDTSTSSDYLVTYYVTDLWHRGIQSIAAEGARNHGLLNIAPNDFFETMLSIPLNISEQKKVGDFFISLDHLITLHQRKLEKLKIIKKSMLENLFPQNGEKTPKNRFSGFTKDWEQRKLSEIALRESNFRLSSPDLPCVEYEDVVSEAGILNNDIRSKKIVKTGIVFDDNHVLYGKLRPYLHNWLCPYFSGVAVGDWWVLKPCYVVREFIYRIIQTKRFDNATNQSYGSKMPRADWNLVSNTEFMIPPDSSEQEKIGLYFKEIDNLITLHQRKLEKLKIIKKSMLENLFPQNGEKTPKNRFSGFTKDWEQRKTSELFKITRGYVLAANITAADKSGDNPYPVYSSQTKDNGLMGYYKDYLYENAITWTTDGANAGTVNYRGEKFYCTNVCGVLLGDKVTPNQMLAEAINNVAKGHVSYVGNPKLMNNVMAEICIWLPSEDTERKAISTFVYSLDRLITLHQSKLEKLQKIKKSMLESMFV